MFSLTISATCETLDEILADLEATVDRQIAEVADREPGELRRELEHDGPIGCGVTGAGADVTAVIAWESDGPDIPLGLDATPQLSESNIPW